MARLARDSATSWVASLPANHTTGTERLVLFVLAIDATNGISACGQVRLVYRAGIGVDLLRSTLHSLSVPTTIRPPLIERMPKRRAHDPDRYLLAPGDRTTKHRMLPLVSTTDA